MPFCLLQKLPNPSVEEEKNSFPLMKKNFYQCQIWCEAVQNFRMSIRFVYVQLYSPDKLIDLVNCIAKLRILNYH